MIDTKTQSSTKSSNRLFLYIVLSLILGLLAGQAVYMFCGEAFRADFATNTKVLGTMFIRLVQMIIAPLVFCTIVVGVCKMGDMKMVGRVGGKALLWFISASLISLTIGMIWVNILEPGVSTSLDLSAAAEGSDVLAGGTGMGGFAGFITHLIPKSLFEALAHNEILQILVFAIMFSMVLATMGSKAKSIVDALDTVAHAVLKMVNYIMYVAPLAVFGTIASAVAGHGLSVFKVYGNFLLAFLVGILTLWAALLLVGYFVLGRKQLMSLIRAIRSPLLIAFSTTSSEAVFPKLVEELENNGCDPKYVSFILPLGYSFNLDGSMMYMTFASIFIAQLFGVELSLSTQIGMLLVLMITSKGIAGVPRASLIVVIACCSMFGIPPEGVALLIPIDHFCDMARSMTNVMGNALAIKVVDKWEKRSAPKTLQADHI